jgi:hypothetical protein
MSVNRVGDPKPVENTGLFLFDAAAGRVDPDCRPDRLVNVFTKARYTGRRYSGTGTRQ